MSDYGFGKKPEAKFVDESLLDLSGIKRTSLPLDPAREVVALERGAALGFVDREVGEGRQPNIRRRRPTAPQSSIYIKGPKDTLDWFIEYTNKRAHRSYWQTLEEFRSMVKE